METRLEMVRRHVREGAARLAQQRELLADLRDAGRPTGAAEDLLHLLEEIQSEHERHLARLEG